MKKIIFFLLFFLLLFGCMQKIDSKVVINSVYNAWASKNMDVPFDKEITFNSDYLFLTNDSLNEIKDKLINIKKEIEVYDKTKEYYALNSYVNANIKFAEFLIEEKKVKEKVSNLKDLNTEEQKTDYFKTICSTQNELKELDNSLNAMIEKAGEYNDSIKGLNQYTEYLNKLKVKKGNELNLKKISNQEFKLNYLLVFLENSCELESDLNEWEYDFNSFVEFNDLCLNKKVFNEFKERITALKEKTDKAVNAVQTLSNAEQFDLNTEIDSVKKEIYSAIEDISNINKQLDLVCEDN